MKLITYPLMILMGILVILLFTGCIPKEKIDPVMINESEDLDGSLLEEIDEEEMTMDSETLKMKLLDADAIELRDIENRTIGMLKDRENINQLIEKLYSYPIQNTYLDDYEKSKIIGPINFYILGKEDVFGFVREDFIYIEGYYFLMNAKETREMEKLFKTHIVERPAVEE